MSLSTFSYELFGGCSSLNFITHLEDGWCDSLKFDIGILFLLNYTMIWCAYKINYQNIHEFSVILLAYTRILIIMIGIFVIAGNLGKILYKTLKLTTIMYDEIVFW